MNIFETIKNKIVFCSFKKFKTKPLRYFLIEYLETLDTPVGCALLHEKHTAVGVGRSKSDISKVVVKNGLLPIEIREVIKPVTDTRVPKKREIHS